MKYVYLVENKVHEIIPEFNPVFPDIPIANRYSAEFLADCVAVDDATEVEQNYIYNPETKTFTPESEIGWEEPDEPEPTEPTKEQRLTELEHENEQLKQQITQTQLAMTEVYEMMLGGTK